MPKKSGCVPDFFDVYREKVTVWKLSDNFGTAHDPFLLVGEAVVS